MFCFRVIGDRDYWVSEHLELDIGHGYTGVSVSAMPFTATPDWQLVVNTLDIGGPALVRLEFYMTTAGGELSIDNVNLF